MNRLLGNGIKWCWSSTCDQVLETIKQELLSPRVLAHYDFELPVTVATHHSHYGIGAVISHVYPRVDGPEQPITFASCTLTSSENNCAQVEKEALSVIFGVKKFHQYLYGRRFSLITNHKPLCVIFGPIRKLFHP